MKIDYYVYKFMFIIILFAMQPQKLAIHVKNITVYSPYRGAIVYCQSTVSESSAVVSAAIIGWLHQWIHQLMLDFQLVTNDQYK
jgi:hypothetical protein